MTHTAYSPKRAAETVERISGQMRAAALRGDVREVEGCLSGIVAQVQKATAAGKLADLKAELSKRGLA